LIRALAKGDQCSKPSIPTSTGIPPSIASKQGLAGHKELAAFAFERTRMPIVVADARQPDYPVVLVNQALLELTQ
jgi:hypothetical protein